MKKEEIALKINSALKKIESHSGKAEKISSKIAPHKTVVSLSLVSSLVLLLVGFKALAIVVLILTPVLIAVGRTVEGREDEVLREIEEQKKLDKVARQEELLKKKEKVDSTMEHRLEKKESVEAVSKVKETKNKKTEE